ncbi:hypothetical protein GGI20_001840 [Coemansia sp. BCRC 34301]|nr:hypothetical protein GGI20_001840 [Coemansia sp. BCRC 34301]
MIIARTASLIVLVAACAVASAGAGIELGNLPHDGAVSSHPAQFTGMMPDELSSWMAEQSLSAKTATTSDRPAAGAIEEQESMEALRTADFISDIVAALWHYSAK